MRAQPQEQARAHRSGGEQQPPTRAKLPRRQKRPGHRHGPQPPDRTAGETRQVPTFTLPAAAGLALPRLTNVPANYSIDNEEKTAAQVALSLLDAGLVEEQDGATASPDIIIRNAIARTLGDCLTFSGLDLEFRLIKQDGTDCFYLLVFVDGSTLIDFDPAAAVLDELDPQLGPSLLGYIYRNLDLTPAFTPEVTRDYIQAHVWFGEEDDSALLEQARDELSHQSDGNPDAFDEDDVRLYADQNYLTIEQVDERLEPRYQKNGSLTLAECRERFGHLPTVLRVVEALEKLGELSKALPDNDMDVYNEMDGEVPFSIIVTHGGEHSLVREIYGEFEDMLYQSGIDFLPTHAFMFDPDDPASLEALKDALVLCRLILLETSELCHALEEIA